jgi:hypothetical protein
MVVNWTAVTIRLKCTLFVRYLFVHYFCLLLYFLFNLHYTVIQVPLNKQSSNASKQGLRLRLDSWTRE